MLATVLPHNWATLYCMCKIMAEIDWLWVTCSAPDVKACEFSLGIWLSATMVPKCFFDTLGKEEEKPNLISVDSVLSLSVPRALQHTVWEPVNCWKSMLMHGIGSGVFNRGDSLFNISQIGNSVICSVPHTACQCTRWLIQILEESWKVKKSRKPCVHQSKC